MTKLAVVQYFLAHLCPDLVEIKSKVEIGSMLSPYIHSGRRTKVIFEFPFLFLETFYWSDN